MRQKTEIIQDLEENEILPRLKTIETLQSEVNALQMTVSALRGLNGEAIAKRKELIIDTALKNYPGYPMNDSLLAKYNFLENRTLRLWSKDAFDNLIEELEKSIPNSTTLKDGRKKIYYYIQTGKLIRVTYAGKRKYTFFATRMEWFQRKENNGKIEYHLLPEHQPEASELAALSEEQIKYPLISLNEIN